MKADSFKCEYDKFAQGANSAELVLLEYRGVPNVPFFDAMSTTIAAHLVSVKKDN